MALRTQKCKTCRCWRTQSDFVRRNKVWKMCNQCALWKEKQRARIQHIRNMRKLDQVQSQMDQMHYEQVLQDVQDNNQQIEYFVQSQPLDFSTQSQSQSTSQNFSLKLVIGAFLIAIVLYFVYQMYM